MPNPDQPSRSHSLRVLLPYLPLLRGQVPELAAVLVLMLLATAVSLAIPLEAGRLVDVFSGDGPRPPLAQALGILGGLLAVQLVGSFFYQYLSQRLGLRTVVRLRQRLFAHLLALPSLYFTDQKAGDLSARMTSDVGTIQYLLTSGLVALVRAVITLVGAIILMSQLNVRLTLVVVLLVPSTVLLVSFFGRQPAAPLAPDVRRPGRAEQPRPGGGRSHPRDQGLRQPGSRAGALFRAASRQLPRGRTGPRLALGGPGIRRPDPALDHPHRGGHVRLLPELAGPQHLR